MPNPIEGLLRANTFTPSRNKEGTRQRKLRSWSGLARLMLATSSTHLDCGFWGKEMDTRDMLVSLVGYVLFVAMAIALVAGVMASF